MGQFRGPSLRLRFAALCLLSAVPALILIAIAQTRERSTELAEMRGRAGRMSRAASAEMQRVVDGAGQLLLGLSVAPQVRRGDLAECSRLFAQARSDYPVYANVGLVDLKGDVVASALPLGRGLNVSSRPWFSRVLSTAEMSIEGCELGPISGRPVFLCVRRVQGDDGRPSGFVFTSVDLDWIENFAAGGRLAAGWTLEAIDHQGVIWARCPGTDSIRQGVTRETPAVQQVIDRRSVDAVGIDGERRFWSSEPYSPALEQVGICMVVGTPRSAALAGADRALWVNLLVLTLAAGSAVLLAWIGGGMLLLRPIEDLVVATRRLASGDLTARAGLTSGPRELVRLGRSFDEMAGELEQASAARAQAEQALRESESRLRRLIESNIIGIAFGLASDTRVTGANDAFLRIVGATRQDLEEGRLDWSRLTDPRYAELDHRARQEAVRSGRFSPFEKEYVRSDGLRVPVLIGGAMVDQDRGELVVFVVDLTDKKQAEEMLRRSQKMESIGRLAGGISHDFGNLLAVICGYTEALLRRSAQDHPYREHLEEIERAAERGTKLVRQLLAFSRGQDLSPAPVVFDHAVRDVCEMIRRLLDREMTIELSCNAGDARLMAASGQIEQVLLNLALNARDAMPTGGTLTISTGLTQIDGPSHPCKQLPAGDYILLSVRDTGRGMDAETCAKVFEPFFSTKGQGTGLGLWIVYGIIEQWGGCIQVQSEIGKGTLFEMYLPTPGRGRA